MSTFTSIQVVVRVKRRRDQPSEECLLLMEENDMKSTKLSKNIKDFKDLNINNENNNDNHLFQGKLLLNRIETVNSNNQIIDNTDISNSKFDRNHAKETIWIQRSRKVLRTNDSEKVLVVEVDQAHESQSKINLSNNDVNNIQSSKVKILDPANRIMDEGIERAWRIGDFNGIANAIQRGAKIDFQRENSTPRGITALMAAVKHCNVRMVTRLLDNGANIMIADASGMTALDLLKSFKETIKENQRSTFWEISILFNKALKKYHQYTMNQQEDDTIISDDIEYVFDIYKISDDKVKRTSAALDEKQSNTSNLNWETLVQTPIIAVEGIHIRSDGNVDLVFDYDSDWSDLADDEDPDSNDERYHGNDYPDEEDDQDDSDMENDFVADKFRKDDSDSDSESDTKKYPWRKQPIGHVSHYHVPGDEDSGYANATSKSLRKIYQEDDDSSDDEDEFHQRLRSTKAEKQLMFAANRHEFDRQGLPKYGYDLSDEEDQIYCNDDYNLQDLNRIRDMYKTRLDNTLNSIPPPFSRMNDKPSKDTIAYDSDLDHED